MWWCIRTLGVHTYVRATSHIVFFYFMLLQLRRLSVAEYVCVVLAAARSLYAWARSLAATAASAIVLRPTIGGLSVAARGTVGLRCGSSCRRQLEVVAPERPSWRTTVAVCA